MAQIVAGFYPASTGNEVIFVNKYCCFFKQLTGIKYISSLVPILSGF